MSIIKDGSGTGRTLRINSENRADVESVTRPLDQHINEVYAKVFSVAFDAIDPVGADDYFYYMKNTGTKNLHVTDIRIRSTVAGVVEVHGVTGTASFTSETAITPTNRTIGSAESLTATTSADTNVTGLTSSGVLFYVPCETANEENEFKTSSHIIIPPGQAMALLWDTSTGALSGVVSVYEDQGVS